MKQLWSKRESPLLLLFEGDPPTKRQAVLQCTSLLSFHLSFRRSEECENVSDPTLQRTPAFNLNEGPASMSMSVSNEVVHPGARFKST